MSWDSGPRLNLNGIEDKCCVQDCLVEACPLTLCAMEYPGGVNGFKSDLRLLSILDGGKDIKEAAKELGISQSQAERKYNRANLFAGHKTKTLLSNKF